METFWFFGVRFCHAYDSDFLFSLAHNRSYDSAYDSDSDSKQIKNQWNECLEVISQSYEGTQQLFSLIKFVRHISFLKRHILFAILL